MSFEVRHFEYYKGEVLKYFMINLVVVLDFLTFKFIFEQYFQRNS